MIKPRGLNHPARFFITYLIVVLTLVGALRLMCEALDLTGQRTNRWAKSRLRGSLGYLGNEELKTKPLILGVGTSELQSGFDPIEVDRGVAEQGFSSTTLNMSVENLTMFFPLYFARLANELKRNQLRPKIIFVHLTAHRLTKKSQVAESTVVRYSDYPAVLFDTAMFFHFQESLDDKLIAAFNKWALGENSLLQVQYFFNSLWGKQILRPRNFRMRQHLWQHKRFHPEPAWDPARHGAFYFNRENLTSEVDELNENMRQPEGIEDIADNLQLCCDYYDMNIDDDFVVRTAQHLKSLSAFAEKIVILNLPENPMIRRTLESRARRLGAVHKVSEVSGAELWNLEAMDKWSSEVDFNDVTHFSHAGMMHVSRVLSRLISQSLAESGFAPDQHK